MKRVMLVAIVAALSLANISFAVPILDQAQESSDYQTRIFYTKQNVCQTFTPEATGELVSVSVLLSSSYNQEAPATISILGTTGENKQPDSASVLWTQYFPAGLSPGWFEVDLSSAPPLLSAGTSYGIEISCSELAASTKKNYWNYNRADNLYAEGKLWQKNNAGSNWIPLQNPANSGPETAPDAAFRTYMVVPEPATMMMLLSGCLLTAVRWRPKPSA